VTTTGRPGYLVDLPGELALYAIGVACALTIYSDVPGDWGRPAAAALAVAVGFAAVRWLIRPPTRRPRARYPMIVLIGLAAAATAAGLIAGDPSGAAWTFVGAVLIALAVLTPDGWAAAGSLLMASIFAATGVLLVAMAIVPLPDVAPMPKALGILGAALAACAPAMVRVSLRSLPVMMSVLGVGALVTGVLLLPDRSMGGAPFASILAGAVFGGLGIRMLHMNGTWQRLWTRWRALIRRPGRG
jgi:hypothetical protein